MIWLRDNEGACRPKGKGGREKEEREEQVVGMIRTALLKIQCTRVKCARAGRMDLTWIAVPSLHRKGMS